MLGLSKKRETLKSGLFLRILSQDSEPERTLRHWERQGAQHVCRSILLLFMELPAVNNRFSAQLFINYLFFDYHFYNLGKDQVFLFEHPRGKFFLRVSRHDRDP